MRLSTCQHASRQEWALVGSLRCNFLYAHIQDVARPCFCLACAVQIRALVTTLLVGLPLLRVLISMPTPSQTHSVQLYQALSPLMPAQVKGCGGSRMYHSRGFGFKFYLENLAQVCSISAIFARPTAYMHQCRLKQRFQHSSFGLLALLLPRPPVS